MGKICKTRCLFWGFKVSIWRKKTFIWPPNDELWDMTKKNPTYCVFKLIRDCGIGESFPENSQAPIGSTPNS